MEDDLMFLGRPTPGAFGSGASSSSSSGFASARSQPPTDASSSSSSSSLVFTLPISCQICLSKVKDPVICSNRHVFCKSCMDVWLQRNQQCPACRVQVTEENPLRSILGGLSVTEEQDDDDDDDGARMTNGGVVDAEKAKAARNSKKNLRKARIELLFNEYEEEIEDLREELKEARERNGRTEDELRDVKEALAKRQQQHQHHSSTSNGSSSTPRDPHTAAKLAELTAKLQEANDTYLKVLKDVDALKKENGGLKEEKESLGFEVSRLRSRLQLRSPAKMGRYATVAMESEAASTRKEMERLKKALAHADANVEKMQREQDHLRIFHESCRDAACPLKSNRGENSGAKTNISDVESARNVGNNVGNHIGNNVDSDDERTPRTSSALSLPDSPSTTLGLLTLRSPAAAASGPSAASRQSSAAKCMRNLFFAPSAAAAGSVAGSRTIDDDATTGRRPRTNESSSSVAFSNADADATLTDVTLTDVSNVTDDTVTEGGGGLAARGDSSYVSTSSSMRLSLPSSSFRFAPAGDAGETASASAGVSPRDGRPTPSAAASAAGLGEEASEVDVSLEPDVQDCLSLMRAAERNIRSRESAASANVDDAAHLPISSSSDSVRFPTSSSAHLPTSSSHSVKHPTSSSSAFASRDASSTHSRSSSAATDSTVISLAYSSSSFSSSSSAAASSSSAASSWIRDQAERLDAPTSTSASDGITREFPLPSRRLEGAEMTKRLDQRPLKREISQGELPSTKNPKH